MNNTTNEKKDTWIKLESEKFECKECANEVAPQTNDVEGIVDLDLEKAAEELSEYPNKVIYAICPVCGMEYLVKQYEGELYLEESEELK